MNEPSVLDFVKDKLAFWRPSRLHWPDEADGEQAVIETGKNQQQPVPDDAAPQPAQREFSMPRLHWLVFLPPIFALAAQSFIEPPGRGWQPAVVLYALCAVALGYAWHRKELDLEDLPVEGGEGTSPAHLHTAALTASTGLLAGLAAGAGGFFARQGQMLAGAAVALGLALGGFLLLAGVLRSPREPINLNWQSRRLAFLMAALLLLTWISLQGDVFNLLNVLLWLAVMTAGWAALTWRVPLRFVSKELERLKKPIQIQLSWWHVALALVLAVVLFFRLYNLNGLPGEMFSDHAEKLYDVQDLLNGRFVPFFERNTGREMFQFYWTALVSLVFGTGISFMSLKIGTVLAGLITLWFIYRAGMELGGKWVALLALLFAGVGYWPNVISRIGLRFPLYPFLTAPVLFFLLRGFRRREITDFVWAGVWLGIGLHGYTAARIAPLWVLSAFALFWIHRQSRGMRWQALVWLLSLAFMTLLVVLPLYHYAMAQPDLVMQRSLTRLSDSETAIQGSVALIFLSNLWRALIMPFWDNGVVWVHSIPGRPALASLDASLFFVGTVLILLRYVRKRDWRDLFLLLSIPILMLPSVLSIAFPDENPSLNRTAGAYVVVFLIQAVGAKAVLEALWNKTRAISGKWAVVGLATILAAGSILSNGQLFFGDYNLQYRMNAWNTSELGAVMRGFAEVNGTAETSWVVGYPYWVDTRLVGINAGFPHRNPEIFADTLPGTFNDPRPKLYLLNPEDHTSLDILRKQYPDATYRVRASQIPGRSFGIFTVAGEKAP